MKKKVKQTVGVLIGLGCVLFCIYLCNLNDVHFKRGCVKDIVSAIENYETLIVYYGQEDCGACKVFAENLRNTGNRLKKNILYIDADSLSAEDEKILIEYSVTQTPTLIVVNDGKPYFYRNIANINDLENAITNVNIIEERFEGLVDINYSELEQKLKKGLDFFLYIGRKDCRDCVKFNPILEECLAKQELQGMYYLDISVYRDLAKVENAKKEDIEFYEAIKKRFDITWVPSIYHIRNGMIIAKYEFLDEQYYEMEKELQEREERYYIEELYNWINIEAK